MAVPLISCPLCSQPGFNTLESLRDGLIGSVTRQIVCPVCHDVLVGLDKFTIHLFSHFLQSNSHQQPRYHHHPVETVVSVQPPQQTQVYKPPDSLVQISYNVQHNASIVTHNPAPSNVLLRKNMNHTRALKPADSKSTNEAKNIAKSNAEQEVMSPQTSTTRIVEQKQVKKTHFDSTFENVALLESCGLLQDETGLVSKTTESHMATLPMEENVPRRESLHEEALPMQQVPSDKTGSLRCNLCNFSFPDDHILTLHRQLVHAGSEETNEKRPFGCYLCSKEFKMRGSLMVHLRVAHGGSTAGRSKESDGGAKQFSCATCAKNFKKEQHLSQHMKTHEGKQWPCDVCQKLFTTKYFLKKHKRLHTGEMPYSCSVCSKTFTFQQSMHKHALYHRDDKPHACTECNRSFKELSTLHNHRRIHTGEKPFACETCGKCFRQRVSYLVHRRIHTGIMPYKCTACGKSFRYKVSERTHKCPSQPPGTVVRQTGDLVQKLQQRAALHATDTVLANNQFVIVLDDNLRQKVYVQPVSDASTWSEQNKRKEASTWLEEGKRKDSTVWLEEDKRKDTATWLEEGKRKDSTTSLEGDKRKDSTTWLEEDKGKDAASWTEQEKHKEDGLDLMAETTDFFSLVDNMPSPAERMRGLSIASPRGTEDVGSRSEDGQSEILQTINEDSFKQFLYNNQI